MVILPLSLGDDDNQKHVKDMLGRSKWHSIPFLDSSTIDFVHEHGCNKLLQNDKCVSIPLRGVQERQGVGRERELLLIHANCFHTVMYLLPYIKGLPRKLDLD